MSSGRYQSRLFNLFSRQSRRLGDRLALGWRQAKVAVAWGAQIVLYPAYALYQTTRLVGRQIEQTVQRVFPKLGLVERVAPAADLNRSEREPPQSLPSDTPILQTLAALQEFPLPLLQPASSIAELTGSNPSIAIDLAVVAIPGLVPNEPDLLAVQDTEQQSSAIASQPHQLQSLRVRGIASLLDSRKLVLTTGQNQILDILTPPQQTQLQQQIIWELASYWRTQRLLLQQQLAAMLPPLPADQPHLLPPVRVLRRLMAWVQTGSVAIAANLFREAELIRAAPVLKATFQMLRAMNPDQIEYPGRIEHWLLEQIDQMSLSRSKPGSDSGDVAGAIVIAGSTALKSQRPAARTMRGWFQRQDRSQGETSRVDPILVKGHTPRALPAASQGRSPVKADGISKVSASRAMEQAEHGFQDNSLSAPIVATQTTPTTSSSWIETKATLVGYIKHPLEQFLEWLDLGMLWLEKLGEKLWQWLRRQS
jgi:hypothetical protein